MKIRPIYCLFFVNLMVCLTALPTKGEIIRVYRPDTGMVKFAAQEIKSALDELKHEIDEELLIEYDEDSLDVSIVLMGAEQAREQGFSVPAVEEQGFSIQTSNNKTFLVIGADDRGIMYGGLHLAEQIRLQDGLNGIEATIREPYINRRGIKFNIPLDARTPSYDDSGDAAQNNYAEMWNFDFWQGFLDNMARHRYNTLTLWNPHPFPSIVKLDKYPEAALDNVLDNLKIVKTMSIDEKIEFWRKVMSYAKERGIDIYFITWNICMNSVEGKYGITNEQDNPKTIAYVRESVKQTLLTYPDLAGIGVTAGEKMEDREDKFAKEKWLWRSYGMGILDAKRNQPDRTVKFIHRVWWTGLENVIREFGNKYPDPFDIGFKYARAHMYSSTNPPFAKPLLEEMEGFDVKCWWNLRNDDIFNFRWGDPDYARDFLRNLPPANKTAGYHMGSDGYVWGREFTSKHPEWPRQLEIEKHWYKFMLWGRLGYNPKLNRAFFEQVLQKKFPQVDNSNLYETWQTASKIIPLVNRFHWNNWDFQWAVEGCFDHDGFHTVRDFIDNPTMEDSGLVSIEDHIKSLIDKKPVKGTTPVEVANQLKQYAKETLLGVQDLMERVGGDKELRHTLIDMEAFAHLGDYYSHKILGAWYLHAYENNLKSEGIQKSLDHLQKAVTAWENYAETASTLYKPQLLARTRVLDWWEILEDIKNDVELVREAN